MTDAYERAFEAIDRPNAHASESDHFWRRDEPALRQSLSPNAPPQLIRGGMFNHQREWWTSGVTDENRRGALIKGLVTGFGGGKSLTLYKRAIGAALENAPTPVIICMPSYPMAKLVTVPTMEALLRGKKSHFGRAFAWSFNGQSPMKFTIRYRGRTATIWLLSSDRPRTLVGANAAGVYMDEPFIQPYEAFEKLMARIRVGKLQEFCLAGTPEQLNWGWELFEGELRKDWEHSGIALVRASTRDNLAMSPEYYQRLLAGYDPETAAAYLEGEFVNLAKGRIYHGFDRKRNVLKRDLGTAAKLGLGIDFNVNPMAFTVFEYTDTDLHYIWEKEIPNADTNYACQIVREEFGDHIEDCYPDPACTQRKTSAEAGRTDKKILQNHGFVVFARRKHPSRRDRYNAVNAGFKPANAPMTPRITVDPDCPKLIRYFTEYTSTNMNTDAGKAMSHLLDGATYGPEYLYGITRPRTHEHQIRIGA